MANNVSDKHFNLYYIFKEDKMNHPMARDNKEKIKAFLENINQAD